MRGLARKWREREGWEKEGRRRKRDKEKRRGGREGMVAMVGGGGGWSVNCQNDPKNF